MKGRDVTDTRDSVHPLELGDRVRVMIEGRSTPVVGTLEDYTTEPSGNPVSLVVRQDDPDPPALVVWRAIQAVEILDG